MARSAQMRAARPARARTVMVAPTPMMRPRGEEEAEAGEESSAACVGVGVRVKGLTGSVRSVNGPTVP